MEPRSSSDTPTAQQHITGRYLGLAALLVAVLAVGLLAIGAQRGAPVNADPTATTPQPSATPTRLLLTMDTKLASVVMPSAAEAWAVGYEEGSTPHRSFVLHLAHGTWTEQPLIGINFTPLDFTPQVIAMASATEGWIGGTDDSFNRLQFGMLLHGINGQWTPMPLPGGTGSIAGIAMVSPTEGWAIDAHGVKGSPPCILHYQQGAWTIAETLPDTVQMSSITMVSPTEGWATGTDQMAGALWHYTQGSWQRVWLHDPQGATLQQISMLSPDEGWGIGSYPLPPQPDEQHEPTAGAIWRYAGGQWQVVERYTDDPGRAIWLSTIQAVAPDDVWVSEADSMGPHLLHLANGAWHAVSLPSKLQILSIAMITPSEGWAVGYGGLIVHYRFGTWIVYPTS